MCFPTSDIKDTDLTTVLLHNKQRDIDANQPGGGLMNGGGRGGIGRGGPGNLGGKPTIPPSEMGGGGYIG